MAIVRVQKCENASTGTSATGTWGASTTAGNLLVAVVGASNSTAADNVPAISGNGSWVEIANCSIETTSGQGLAIKIFYIANAGSQANTGAFTATSCDQGIAVEAVEYSGCAVSDPVHASNSEVGNTNAQETSPVSTTASNVLLFGGMVSYDSSMDTWSTPINSFVIVDQITANVGKVNVCAVERIVSSTGTYEGGAQYGSGTGYCGALAAFLDASQPAPTQRLLKDLARQVLLTPFGNANPNRLLRAG